MEYLLIFLIIMIIATTMYQKRMKKQHNAKKKEYNSDLSLIQTIHRYGIPNINEYANIDLFILDDKMLFETKERKFELKLDKLTAVEFVSKTDLLTKNKSALARGATGALLLGPLGAVAGAASSNGKKHDKGSYLVINFINSNEETKVIILDVKMQIKKAVKISKHMSRKILDKNSTDEAIQL